LPSLAQAVAQAPTGAMFLPKEIPVCQSEVYSVVFFPLLFFFGIENDVELPARRSFSSQADSTVPSVKPFIILPCQHLCNSQNKFRVVLHVIDHLCSGKTKFNYTIYLFFVFHNISFFFQAD